MCGKASRKFCYRPPTKLWDGTIFIHSVHRWGLPSHNARGWANRPNPFSVGRPLSVDRPPTDTVNRRAVCILLECILVEYKFTRSNWLSMNKSKLRSGTVHCPISFQDFKGTSYVTLGNHHACIFFFVAFHFFMKITIVILLHLVHPMFLCLKTSHYLLVDV